jgi:dolichol kinase
MALGVLFALILFPLNAACVGIFALAFGDGVASLAGKLFGRVKLPHAGGKTLEGSSACFAAVYISSFCVLRDPLRAFEVALLAMLIEVLPIKDYDNLLIPVLIGGFVTLLA